MKNGSFEEVKRRLELLERGEELPKHESNQDVIKEDKLDKIIQELREINCKQSTMKNIMVFWFVLTIISIIGMIVYAVFSICMVNEFIKAVNDLLL